MTEPQPAPQDTAWDSDTKLNLAFKEYQFLMEGTDKVTERRQTVNTLFVSINALFLTGVGYLLLQSFQANSQTFWFIVGFLIIAILMTIINQTWLDLSESNRRLVDLRIRYLKQLEHHLRQGHVFPAVDVPLKKDEERAPGKLVETTRGTYSVEDVLYNPNAKKQPLSFSKAEQRIGRTLTFSYWLAFAFAVVAYLVVAGLPVNVSSFPHF